MADALTTDLFKNSVTANDAAEYQGHGIVNYVIPWYMSLAASFPLPTDLPPDWMYPAPLVGYWTRDIILRMTPRHEPFWAGAIAKAAAKIASMSWEIKGERVDRFRNMLVDWGGDGYVPSQKRTIRDYLTTNNGAFIEIVRASSRAGSQIIGLVHLDSLRVMRTNDPNIPYVFLDLKGYYHELREDQVIGLVDMPNTAQAAFGRGTCAADDVYQAVYKMAVMDKYLTEKVTGAGANVIDFITGVNDVQLQSLIKTAQAEAISKGQVYYQGHIIAGILAQVDMKHVAINLRELPDGYDRQKEIENAQLAYANRIGLDPQDINPALVGHGALGTGAQAQILHEKQEGSVLASYQKELTHQLDQKVLPERATFYFAEQDLREEAAKTQIQQVHAQTRQVQVTTGEITASEARALAKEQEDIPKDITVEVLTDEQKPVEDTTPEVVVEANPAGGTQTQPARSTSQVVQQSKDFDPNQSRDESGKWTDESGVTHVIQPERGGRAEGKVLTHGMNERLYRGGQFLPSTTEQSDAREAKRLQKSHADYMGRSQEVAPFKREKPPAPNMISSYSALSSQGAKFNQETGKFDLDSITPQRRSALGEVAYNELIEKLNRYNSGDVWQEMTDQQYQNIHKIKTKKKDIDYAAIKQQLISIKEALTV